MPPVIEPSVFNDCDTGYTSVALPFLKPTCMLMKLIIVKTRHGIKDIRAPMTYGSAAASLPGNMPKSRNKSYPPDCKKEKIACVQIVLSAPVRPLKIAHNKLECRLFLEILSIIARTTLVAPRTSVKIIIIVIAVGSSIFTCVLVTAENVSKSGITASTITPMIAAGVRFSPSFFTAT